ncbi:BamA/TamA family outer membrane protein [Halovulum sp. GXIMD14794]
MERALDSAVPEDEAGKFGFSRGSFVGAPIPFRNPTIGTGLALGAGYLFNADENSDASTIALGGFWTDNGSNGYGALLDLSLFSDRVGVKLAAGTADVTYDFYLLGTPVSFDQKADFIRAEASYGLTEKFALGLGVRYIDTVVRPSALGDLPTSIIPDANLTILKGGAFGEWDARDDTLYPTSGTYARLEAFRGWGLEGRDREYDKATLLTNAYYPIGEKIVLAGRFSACAADREAPFFDSCLLGGTDAMRGFPVTQYIGDRLLSVQGEVRGRLTSRFGYVLFGGAGSVGDDFSDVFDGPLRVAGGVGARIRLSNSFPVDFSIDGTLNDEGEKLLYIYVGQDF